MSGADGKELYDDEHAAFLEHLWGEGYLSPGGEEEVARVLDGVPLAGRTVLDIGCGSGGITVALVRAFDAERVVGVDVEASVCASARRRVREAGLSGRIEIDLVAPGPLPHPDASFDVVFSKDSIVHVPDKFALARDAARLLRRGGIFAVSDWLTDRDGAPSPAMAAYLEAEGLDFAMASPARYREALEAAGFTEIRLLEPRPLVRPGRARRTRPPERSRARSTGRALRRGLHGRPDRHLAQDDPRARQRRALPPPHPRQPPGRLTKVLRRRPPFVRPPLSRLRAMLPSILEGGNRMSQACTEAEDDEATIGRRAFLAGTAAAAGSFALPTGAIAGAAASVPNIRPLGDLLRETVARCAAAKLAPADAYWRERVTCGAEPTDGGFAVPDMRCDVRLIERLPSREGRYRRGPNEWKGLNAPYWNPERHPDIDAMIALVDLVHIVTKARRSYRRSGLTCPAERRGGLLRPHGTCPRYRLRPSRSPTGVVSRPRRPFGA